MVSRHQQDQRPTPLIIEVLRRRDDGDETPTLLLFDDTYRDALSSVVIREVDQ